MATCGVVILAQILAVIHAQSRDAALSLAQSHAHHRVSQFATLAILADKVRFPSGFSVGNAGRFIL